MLRLNENTTMKEIVHSTSWFVVYPKTIDFKFLEIEIEEIPNYLDPMLDVPENPILSEGIGIGMMWDDEEAFAYYYEDKEKATFTIKFKAKIK